MQQSFRERDRKVENLQFLQRYIKKICLNFSGDWAPARVFWVSHWVQFKHAYKFDWAWVGLVLFMDYRLCLLFSLWFFSLSNLLSWYMSRLDFTSNCKLSPLCRLAYIFLDSLHSFHCQLTSITPKYAFSFWSKLPIIVLTGIMHCYSPLIRPKSQKLL